MQANLRCIDAKSRAKPRQREFAPGSARGGSPGECTATGCLGWCCRVVRGAPWGAHAAWRVFAGRIWATRGASGVRLTKRTRVCCRAVSFHLFPWSARAVGERHGDSQDPRLIGGQGGQGRQGRQACQAGEASRQRWNGGLPGSASAWRTATCIQVCFRHSASCSFSGLLGQQPRVKIADPPAALVKDGTGQCALCAACTVNLALVAEHTVVSGIDVHIPLDID